MVAISDCTTCAHNKVCKLKDEFCMISSQTASGKKLPDYVTATITCKEFLKYPILGVREAVAFPR